MRMSLFVHEFSAGVRTRCLCCMQPHLEIRACSINIRMQTSASCDVESAAWARTEFVFALVNSVGRDATAADVGGATSLQLMLKRLNRRALSAWRSNGKAERRSRRICRTLTTDGRLHDNACRPKYVERSIFCPYPVRPVGFCARRCAAEWRLPDSVLQSGACLANSDATAAADQKSPLEAFGDRVFAQDLIIMVSIIFSFLFSLLSPPPPPPLLPSFSPPPPRPSKF